MIENATIEKAASVEVSRSARTLFNLLDVCVADARIRFIVNGADHLVGQQPQTRTEPPKVTLRVNRDRFFPRFLGGGNLGLGESYMDGDFDIVDGELAEFLTILLRNRLNEKIRNNWRMSLEVLRTRLINVFRGKEGNIHVHYDTGVDKFEASLDRTMAYSCGYKRFPDDDLDQLQFNKLDRVCRKLRLKEGERLLDIGCGFAGLLIHAAQNFGISGVGITLSHDQCERGKAKVAAAGLAGKVSIQYQDFRQLSGTFDKVASVGMFEHVPRQEYKHYFGKIAEVLTQPGLALVHTGGCSGPVNEHDPFTQKYIFPNSNMPKLSEIAHHLEQNSMAIWDVENLKPHYAHTARGWLHRFRENKHSLDPEKYDKRFERMWEHFLACIIAAAQASDSAVFQVLFSRDYTTEIPLQRV